MLIAGEVIMIELGDIIDMLYIENNNPIYIFDDGEVFEYGEDDIADKLDYIVDSIDVYNDRVEINLED